MIIALAGHNGFIGKKIQEKLNNHRFILLDRDVLYGSKEKLAEMIRGTDAVVNFAGYPVSKRWTRKAKREIFRSRVVLTGNIVEAINSLEDKPKLFINSSAIGIYAIDSIVTEEDTIFEDNYLAEIVKQWEEEADKISSEVRLIKIRLGMVLGNEGGAFPRLKRLFTAGLGGIIGSGNQVYSFIHIDDVVMGINFLLNSEHSGTFNFTAPKPVTNKVFTKTLASKTGKRAFFYVPSFGLRIIMGQSSLIALKGQTVYPKRLLDAGYNFTFATIENALDNLIGRK